MQTNDNTQVFWVLFYNSEHKIIKRLFKKGFQHVVLLTRDKFNWVLFDPSFLYIKFNILAYDVNTDVPQIFAQKATKVIKYELAQTIDNKVQFNFCLMTCVSICKHFLQIRNALVQTPYQLYKYLKKRGF